MKRTLKKYFIPHTENDHKPHFLRSRTILYLAGVVLLLEAAFLFQSFFVISHTNFLAAILPNVLIDETNKNRQTDNLVQLTPSSLLMDAAHLKAKDMAEKGYFAHVSPENQTPWYWLNEVGYTFSHAGENLAVNFVDSKDVTEAWMSSSKHRANILSQNYTEIGIGTARGVYKGSEAIFVVQLFGRPSAPTESFVEEEVESVVKEFETETIAAAVQNTDLSEPTSIVIQEAEISGVVSPDSEVIPSSSRVEQIASSPKTIMWYMFGILSIIILLALLLKIFIAIRIQHPRLIASATLLIICIGVISFANEQITVLTAKIL